MSAWYTRMFNADYLRCYAHLDEIAVAQAEDVLACLGLPEGARILDLAGGYGRIAVPLAQRGYRVMVHDLSTDFLRVGRERAAAAGVELEWRHGDMRAVPATGDYDAVISMFSSFGYFERAPPGKGDARSAVAVVMDRAPGRLPFQPDIGAAERPQSDADRLGGVDLRELEGRQEFQATPIHGADWLVVVQSDV